MKKTRKQIVVDGQNALRELELSAITQADHVRIDRVRSALVSLDDERSEARAIVEFARDALMAIRASNGPHHDRDAGLFEFAATAIEACDEALDRRFGIPKRNA